MSDLNDLFKALAEAKRADPVAKKAKKIEEEVKQVVKSDLSELFSQLATIQKKVEILPEDTKGKAEAQQMIAEVMDEPVKEQVTPLTPDVEKYLTNKTGSVFKQPEENVTDKNIEDVKKKINYLEQWISKVAIAGPGSGEVEFRYLDDVNRSTMTQSNDNWVLEYDATTKKAQFTKDIGPIDSVRFNTDHIDDHTDPGTLCWNLDDKTLNLHHDNGIKQQIGQEQYYPPVKNLTGSTISNGTVVMFAGAEEENQSRLLIAPMIADGTYLSLYAMGVATADIADGDEGFVTSFGYVNDVDTSMWTKGDILYADPNNPGMMTNIKPTSPDNCVVIAAVVKSDETTGRIMVRPTIEQRSLYGRFSSVIDQAPLAINTPYAVQFGTTDVSRGFHADGEAIPDYSKIYAEESGFYKFDATLSLTSTNSSAKAFYVWMRKNGVDIPRSAKRQSITGNGTYQTLAYIYSTSLNKDDYIQIMYASDDTTVSIDAPAATAFCPAIPSATIVCTQIAL